MTGFDRDKINFSKSQQKRVPTPVRFREVARKGRVGKGEGAPNWRDRGWVRVDFFWAGNSWRSPGKWSIH